MFAGFKALSANFTPTPNQFFDVILDEEDCVVKVVGHLIRATLGWEDPRTKSRRVEAALPMSAFMERGMARNSVRKGIDLAIARGYIVKTAEEERRAPARYALRWDDEEGQKEALRRERLVNGERGSKNDPVKFCKRRGSKNDPLLYIRSPKKKEKEKQTTLNVGGPVNFVATTGGNQTEGNQTAPSHAVFEDALNREAIALVEELRDWGSERRHRQMLSICDRHGLTDLPRQALQATRERMAMESKRGMVEKPGAYYAHILLKLLADRQVFVPTASEKDGDDPEEVARLVRQSLGLGD